MAVARVTGNYPLIYGPYQLHPNLFLFQKLLEMAEEAGLKNIENIKRK